MLYDGLLYYGQFCRLEVILEKMSRAEIEELLSQLSPEKAEAAKEQAKQKGWSEKQLSYYLEKKVGWQRLEEMATREVDGPDEPVDAEKIAAELQEFNSHPQGRMSRRPQARRRGPLHRG